VNVPTQGLAGHIVVAGGGRVGQTTAEALGTLDLPFVVIEYDARRFEQLRKTALPAVYGDAGQAPVLEAASIRRARAMLITVPAFPEVRQIVRVAGGLVPGLPIIARADGPDAVAALYELGIQEVASPEFEAAIAMTRLALARLGVLPSDIIRAVDGIRRRRYSR
jgi:CPA2 family monovalent cation:H+ antiporter-2